MSKSISGTLGHSPKFLLDIPPSRVYPVGMTTELIVSGMTCGHCETAVKNALKDVPGVEDVRVDLKGGSAAVEGNVDAQALIAAVTEEGYGAQVRQ
ncbi:hypothetical protein GCM10008949_48240 [Deinococcus humi]|nr:hypothetical protein GCM10008949_48240 [Deinococcus humi]